MPTSFTCVVVTDTLQPARPNFTMLVDTGLGVKNLTALVFADDDVVDRLFNGITAKEMSMRSISRFRLGTAPSDKVADLAIDIALALQQRASESNKEQLAALIAEVEAGLLAGLIEVDFRGVVTFSFKVFP